MQAQPSGGPVQTPEAGKSDHLGEGRFVCQSMMSFVPCNNFNICYEVDGGHVTV